MRWYWFACRKNCAAVRVCPARSAGAERRRGLRLGFLGEPDPALLPPLLVAGLDGAAKPRDVEHVAATLLRLGDEPEHLRAERMGRLEKVEHGCLDPYASSFETAASRPPQDEENSCFSSSS
jgi:hypothetical protein